MWWFALRPRDEAHHCVAFELWPLATTLHCYVLLYIDTVIDCLLIKKAGTLNQIRQILVPVSREVSLFI